MMIGRVFDVDDILLNTLGGYIGYLCYHYGHKFSTKLPSFCKSEWFLNILSVIILLCVIAIIW